MKVSLSYAHWSLRKWGRKIGKFLSFLQKKCFFLCEKKCILTYPMHLGVLGRSSLEPLLLRHLRFSEIFRLARFFKLRKSISWRTSKFLPILPIFRWSARSNRPNICISWRIRTPHCSCWRVYHRAVKNGNFKLKYFWVSAKKLTRILTFLFVYAGAIFRQTIDPELSELFLLNILKPRRDRLLGAVAQWQLRLCFWGDERSERPYCLRRFFFRQNVTSLCISKSFSYFSPSLFLRDNSKFQKRCETECPFWPCKKVPKFFAWAILLA